MKCIHLLLFVLKFIINEPLADLKERWLEVSFV